MLRPRLKRRLTEEVAVDDSIKRVVIGVHKLLLLVRCIFCFLAFAYYFYLSCRIYNILVCLCETL